MTLPSLKQLRYLVHLHEHRNFSRAAESCNVTQAALSSSIQELETVLRLRLVERTRRMVAFTAVGEQVVEKARELLRVAQDLGNIGHGDGALAGVLRLGIIPTVGPFLLPCLLPKFASSYPLLELHVREEFSASLCTALGRGELDCAILALPYPCAALDYDVLFDDPLMLAFHVEDPVGGLATPTEADWTERLLLLPDGHCLRDHALSLCGRADLQRQAMSASTLQTLVHLVDNRLGVTLLPEMAVQAGLLNGLHVTTRILSDPNAKRQIVLAWRSGAALSATYRHLAQAMREARR
ncbi:hydrogen peroxide-inducible genes activator [Nitrospirillum iridis]|uniref:LysR family hydrogen peroxide-inducible transcriptional activator n=1 Tax=Nitrospirillum iridis TaxID=765888 RepID=A0A7X0EGH6_9PROT|nr:hydrogen peroxide-inducible genes activator [Nitrospirillum iridis]MBB6253604.1 LysR family hydrogen peroxide-inducible transcriptional activator [Nitrospirillum iridis]